MTSKNSTLRRARDERKGSHRRPEESVRWAAQRGLTVTWWDGALIVRPSA